MSVTIYVEGGGDDNLTKTNCRKGFRKFIEKLLPGKAMPTIVACRGRSRAYRDFCIALKNRREGDFAILLVDSEAPVGSGNSPWNHFKEREGDGWNRPEGAEDDQAHMMVQCMESWFIADKESVAEWYNDQNFNINKLPPLQQNSVEPIDKNKVGKAIEEATKHTSKSSYHKTRHGFVLLEQIDPKKVIAASEHAKRFYEVLETRLKDRR